MRINITRVQQHIDTTRNMPLPTAATDGATCFDLRAAPPTQVLLPGKTAKILTGFIWEIPKGFVGLVCSRSGLALRSSVFVINAPGIIDSDFRGELCVLLHNAGLDVYRIQPNDRIAQLLITNIIVPATCELQLRQAPTSTSRGESGFGSTGRS